jgi:hypothetical protein
MNWKMAGKKRFWSKREILPAFIQEVRTLEESQDNRSSGRD